MGFCLTCLLLALSVGLHCQTFAEGKCKGQCIKAASCTSTSSDGEYERKLDELKQHTPIITVGPSHNSSILLCIRRFHIIKKKNMYRCVLKKVFEFYTAVLKIYANPDAIGIIDRMNKSLNCTNCERLLKKCKKLPQRYKTAENCMDEILACDAAILQVKKLDDAMKQVNNTEIQERAISELDRLSGCLARPKKMLLEVN
ncbi:uncharacterized protein LOC121317981 isoform X2 [Polyodon spathula]|uniref:uncharacterized protein LOC121317981 isoform X2 n=1 Tax=Polyodon spathula TaxID=7913 RepID=UPI001B7DE17E|nr:uncharacterized protein LOC121317981 isoform X2 [Polyodon spathula]